MTRILVTGGAGFLGAWVVRNLVQTGRSVRVFDRNDDRRVVRAIAGSVADEVDWVTGDLTDTSLVRRATESCAAIVHLAAMLTPACRADPIRGAEVNLIGTLNVFEVARALGVPRIAYASSAAVFGPDDGEHPNPVTHYGAFKLACEASARAYWHDAGIASVGLRLTIVYGPGRETGLTADATLACRAAAAGLPYTIGFSGRQDFVFVADVAAAFAAAATRPYDGAHAFSLTGGAADVTDFAAAIRRSAPSARIDVAGPEVPMAAEFASGSLEALLGPLPRTSLQEGVAETIAHYARTASAS